MIEINTCKPEGMVCNFSNTYGNDMQTICILQRIFVPYVRFNQGV